MEMVTGDASDRAKSSNSATTSASKVCRPRGRKITKSNGQLEKEQFKKRGVYVEKWAYPKPLTEDNKTPPRQRIHPKCTQKGQIAKSSKQESNTAPINPSLNAAAPGQTELHEMVIPPTLKFPRQHSVTPKNQETPLKLIHSTIKNDPYQVKSKKFRSSVLKSQGSAEKVISFKPQRELILTPSVTSTRKPSDVSHQALWSHIFPEGSQSSDSQFEDCIRTYSNSNIGVGSSVSKQQLNKNENDNPTTNDGKDIYNFLVDVLETVYDESVDKMDDTVITKVLSDTSKPCFEIEESVMDKLYKAERNQQVLNDSLTQHKSPIDTRRKESIEQIQKLAEYYNYHNVNVSTLRHRKAHRQPIKFTFDNFCHYEKPANHKPRAEKKTRTLHNEPNLLNLLKEQLSARHKEVDDSDNFYKALCTIAKNKRKYRRIRFDAPMKAAKTDNDEVCRFKGRKVISPSTRQSSKKANMSRKPKSKYTTPTNYSSDSNVSANDGESNHSLQVMGFGYEVKPVKNTNQLFEDPIRLTNYRRKYKTSRINLNYGLKTIRHTWKE